MILCGEWGYSGGREQYLVDVVEELTIRGQTCCVVYAEQSNKPVTIGAAAKVFKYNIPSLTEYETNVDKENTDALSSILDREAPDIVFFSDVKNFLLLRLLVDYGKLVAAAYHGWLFCLRNSKTLYFSKKICSRKLGFGCLLHGCFLGKAKRPSKKKLRYNSLRKLQKVARIYSEIDTHLVASQYMKNLFLQHGFKEEQVKIIGSFTELPSLPNHERTVVNPNVLFLGRIDRYKGVDFLIKSISKIKLPFTCNIIGDGSYLSYCKKLARKHRLGNSVQFLGWLPREETKQYIQAANVIVVPSICPEAFGMAGIEAMAYGKPVVAFDSGGISEWLCNGKTGYLIPPKDIVGLANKIEYLLRNPEHAHEIGTEGRHFVETTFNKKVHFDRLIKIFQEISEN